ncbi:hypothetical protein CPB84DRAFT_1785611 [Gymnopilus junonius]|uniref:F-box domain-containing protein n=1 Tax=Gymnopilus junonius TaxID=109634 RepID=A0A9P5NGC8_GYMJU|nr:hypothetical protein CPB84DRAFT_1785611 [Gymnopilus junonius]
MTFPFILLKICKRWKTVALDSHWLWNNVFVPEYSPKEDNDSMCKFISTWLSLSGALPLDIVHRQPGRLSKGSNVKEAAPYAGQMLRLVLAHEQRLKLLELVIDDYLFNDLHPYLQKSAKILGGPVMGTNIVELTIELHDSFGSVQPQQVEDLFNWISSLPQLMELDLRDKDDTLTLKNVPFERLGNTLTLKRTAMSFDQVLDVIRRCVLVTNLILDIDEEGEDIDEVNPEDHYTLPNLCSIALEDVNGALVALTYLTLPNLMHLRISGLAEDPERCEVLQEFLERSECPLKILSIYDDELSPEDALEVFMLPAIRQIPEVIFTTNEGDAHAFILYMGRLKHKINAVNSAMSLTDTSPVGSQPGPVSVPPFMVGPDRTENEDEYPGSFWFGRKTLSKWGKENNLVSYQDSRFECSTFFLEKFGNAGVRQIDLHSK